MRSATIDYLRTDTTNTKVIGTISGIDSILHLTIFNAETSPNITGGRRASSALKRLLRMEH